MKPLTPEQFAQIFKRGEPVLVRSQVEDKYVERIFVTAIKGAWFPYVCVHEDYENEFIAGGAFETENWFDIKELTSEQKEIAYLRKRVAQLESIIERGAEIDWQ